MAGTDTSPGGTRDNGTTRRRFVTRHDVDDAAAVGGRLLLSPRDVLTSEAAARARDLGVVVERTDGAAPTGRTDGPAVSAGRPAEALTGPRPDDTLRAAVRAAVIAELGSTPDGLDAVIDRVLASRPARSRD